MATLYDLAMQYLNQSLPKTFKYDRTNQPGTPPPVTVPPQDPNAPVKRILPVQGGGGDGFSVYNPDPNRTRTPDRYSPYNYRQAAERNLIGDFYSSGTEAQKLMDSYPDYYTGPQLTGIPGAIAAYAKNSLPGRIIGGVASFVEDKLPVNNRAILENELLGQGFQLNDIGQFVSDGGDAYKEDGSNIMAGYNAAKVTRQTFDKRREKAKKNMTPEGFEKFNKALTAAEDKFFAGSDKATTVFNDKLKQKDIDDGFINDQGSTYDEEIPSFLTDNTISSDNIVGGTNLNDYDGINSLDKIITGINKPGGFLTTPKTLTSGSVLADKNINRIIDDVEIPSSGNDNNAGFNPGVTPGNSGFIGIDKDMDVSPFDFDDAGTYEPPSNNYPDYSNVTTAKGPPGQISKPTASTSLIDAAASYQIQPSNNSGNDSGNKSGGKIVCTMMNESYGFGSFRNKIWLKHSKGLAPEYQKGYHKLFLPLVKIAKTNKVVRKILEHIAVHRTIDIRQESRGKVHLLGRVYRKILEPLCYFVGKHG